MPELTAEQLRNMSPEQIKELQKKSCVFCQIVEGKIAARKVYEDEECMAVMDINPANPGHLILFSKEHYQIMPQIPEYTVEKLFMVSKALTQATLKALKSHGTTIFAANGAAAGQKAPHVIIHIIPRFEGDNLGMNVPEKETTEAELQKIKKTIIPKIKEALGTEKKPINLDVEPEKIGEKVEAEFKEVKEKGKEAKPRKEEKAKKPTKKKTRKKTKKESKTEKESKGKIDLDKLTEMLMKNG